MTPFTMISPVYVVGWGRFSPISGLACFQTHYTPPDLVPWDLPIWLESQQIWKL